jgi:Ni/Co efflux regulator RcnB
MKSKTVLAIVLALSLLPGSVAFADGPDRRGQRGDHEQAQRGHDGRGHGQGNQGRWERREQRDYRDYRNQRGNRPPPQAYREDRRGPGAGPQRNFYRGDRLPSEYRHRNYVVNDWRGHRLSPPPRGYHWVQAGGDYVLVAIATGIILQILLNQ